MPLMQKGPAVGGLSLSSELEKANEGILYQCYCSFYVPPFPAIGFIVGRLCCIDEIPTVG